MNNSIQLVSINKPVDRPWIIFVFGLSLGVLLAVAFEFEYQILLDNIPFALILISLFIPIFYAEFILGFVLGMTYTFGAILPTAFILIFACIGYLIYRFIRPMILKLIRKFNKQPTRNAKP